ncbi:MAG: DUF3530 family protein [Gammaproteobacteria bacterium]|nr:DUF3530 family protein [Gammaproteobacteria bacterium]MCY4313172.1 DUF3530 family protein [Gammaproteobacteria bacterium]
MKKTNGLLTLIMLCMAFTAHASTQTWSDTLKEQRWAEQVVDTLFDGEPVWLEAGGHEFLGIEMQAAEGNTGRAAIVLHGIGIHPNWEQVVRPLRVGLAEHGWHTLSIQMPILLNDADSFDYAPLLDEVSVRINAAIDYLNEHGQQELAIIAHSMGATMTMRYTEDVPDTPIQSLVLIGMQGGSETVYDNAEALKNVRVPVLDLYGSEDLPGVIDFTDRKAQAAGSNPGFKQVEVQGANHFFDGLEDELVEIVSKWLADSLS